MIRLGLVAFFLFNSFVLFAAGQVPEFDGKFVKLLTLNDTPVALQTATVTYKNGDKSVDLIGVVHIGERAYYEKQNRQFKNYDALCYELVAEKGTRIKNRVPGKNPVGFMQKIMKDVLKLEHQLDIVDYEAKNFVHADLSPAVMSKRMAERGDTQLTVTLKVVAEMIQKHNLELLKGNQQNQDVDLLEAVLNPNYIKRMLATQLSKSGEDGLGATLNQILVTDRNIAAMEVVKEQLKTKNKVGLFYGAAHMPDFDRRLKEMGYKPTEVAWSIAWDMRPTKEEILLKLLKKYFEE